MQLRYVAVMLVLACGQSYASTDTEALLACKKRFLSLSPDPITEIPYVESVIDEKRYLFYWGPQTAMIQTKTGAARGICVIGRDNGKGKVTLGGKTLGEFNLWD